MKINEFKVGQKVEDRWFSRLGRGTVVKVMKTRVKIEFQHELWTYDVPHCQFLEKAKPFPPMGKLAPSKIRKGS